MTEGENDEEEDYEETLERDKLIYDNISNRYNLEWDRSKVLDGKASGIISFVGIILALQGGIGANLINSSSKTGILFIVLNEVFILSVLCLSFSIIFGLRAYYVQQVVFFPNANHLIEENKKRDISSLDILRSLEITLADTIDKNTLINDKKSTSIIYGFNFLVAGLLLNLVFIIGLILMTSYSK